VRKVAGQPYQTSAPQIKVAAAEAVEGAWNEWQLFQRSGSRSLTKHLHSSGTVPVLAIVNANPERMVSMIYAGDAVRHLVFDAVATDETRDLRVMLTGEHGRPIFGTAIEPAAPQVRRSLSAAELPWQLNVAASGTGGSLAFPVQRRNYLIFALAVIVLLVSLACYAIARGVLREAAAGRLQSDFVSAVSHEFRSPLTTLRQLTELLAEGRILDEGRRRRYFSVLHTETARLHQLVEDLLDFGRMDAGRRQYRLERIDFSELVRDGIQEFQRQVTPNGHRIEISSDHSPLLVEADREAMRLLVRNLLENAVKYSAEATTVWVETGSEDRSAILRVRDEGIGIPPEEKARIFEKFVRGEAAKKACIPGTGIGLAMVKEIVRVHRGEVDLSSEVGQGSTFMVRLPLS
jgi:signal transduction histidine kinase